MRGRSRSASCQAGSSRRSCIMRRDKPEPPQLLMGWHLAEGLCPIPPPGQRVLARSCGVSQGRLLKASMACLCPHGTLLSTVLANPTGSGWVMERLPKGCWLLWLLKCQEPAGRKLSHPQVVGIHCSNAWHCKIMMLKHSDGTCGLFHIRGQS